MESNTKNANMVATTFPKNMDKKSSQNPRSKISFVLVIIDGSLSCMHGSFSHMYGSLPNMHAMGSNSLFVGESSRIKKVNSCLP